MRILTLGNPMHLSTLLAAWQEQFDARALGFEALDDWVRPVPPLRFFLVADPAFDALMLPGVKPQLHVSHGLVSELYRSIEADGDAILQAVRAPIRAFEGRANSASWRPRLACG